MAPSKAHPVGSFMGGDVDSAAKWREIMAEGNEENIFSPMEIGILQVASKIPAKVLSEKQSVILIDVLAKATLEGIN